MGNGNSRSAVGRIFRISRTLTLVGALAVSLGLNATLFVGGVIYDVVDTFVESAIGLQTASVLQRQALNKLQRQNRQLRGQVQTVRTANRQLRGQVQTVRSANRQLRGQVQTVGVANRQLRGRVQSVRTANQQLRGQVQTVRSTNRQLQREVRTVRSANRHLRGQAQSLGAANRQLQGQVGQVRTTVEQTRKRLQGSAVRSVATLPGRALPFAGTAVSVAITGLLIKDLCDAMKDLDGIEKVARPAAETESTETEVCSVRVPSKEKVWADVVASPKTVWEKSQEFAPDLPDWPDLPDLDVIPGLQEKWRSILRWLQ